MTNIEYSELKKKCKFYFHNFDYVLTQFVVCLRQQPTYFLILRAPVLFNKPLNQVFFFPIT